MTTLASDVGASPAVAAFTRRALVRLSSIELWERYSFYNMFALLALFLSTPVARGGMGWSDGQALSFFGIYLLLVLVTPLAGGYAGDRWLGAAGSLRVGAALLMGGHALLAVAALAPLAARALGAPDLASYAVPLGRITPPQGLPGSLELAYAATTASLYGAIALVALGNGLFKPVLTVIVGRLPHAGPGERDGAFTTFFLFSNIGGLLATLLGGWLAQAYGFGWAFLAAAAGMGASLVLTAVFHRSYIAPLTAAAGRTDEAPVLAEPTPRPSRRRQAAAFAILLSLVVLSSAITSQAYGLVSVFTARHVARTVGSLVVPTAWFTAIDPVTIILVSPLLLALWRRGGRGEHWPASLKIALAFLFMAAMLAALLGAARQVERGGLASPAWIAACLALNAVSEVLLGPAGMSALTRLAPAHRQTFAVGAWTASAGVGSWLSGKVGSAAAEGRMTLILTLLAGVAMATALALIAMRRQAARVTL